ncbi:hypothetical protein MN116_004976 [Schistosoma mekongi]|uniref:Peptidase M14 domain-containing protein n=1 Tax=Schistosoma mekongi TaxID=38744 RepID=A0AAE1ZDP9_SCHME|nr:hypothetical protein MN116_004976 [Schistosoma mekongi]
MLLCKLNVATCTNMRNDNENSSLTLVNVAVNLYLIQLFLINFRPLNFEIIPERIFHINKPPPQRERLYKPTGKEIQPAILGEYNNDNHNINTIVFQYEPLVGKFFTTSKIDGNIGQPINLPNDFNFLKFESRFECGNLSKAICIGPYEYELYLRPDLYTKKYTQWFYFRVQNTENVNSYRFTIVNFYKSTSLFGQGMRPLMYSEKMAKLNGIGWRRVGTEINYYPTKFMEPTANKLQLKSKSQTDDANKLQHAYSLTWKFTFPYPYDTVYFAACYPYTYTQLQEYLNRLALDSSIQKICQQTILCYTLANNPVPLLTITEPYDYDNDKQKSNKSDTETQSVDAHINNKPLVKKRCVVITARVHPGETQSSWMMKGLMDFLISTDPDAKVLRSNFMFKLVPMLNPDGVIVGNYRCSLSGCDLNRKYTSRLKRFFPTIWHTKQMIVNIMKEYEVVVYCDLHGHSRKQQMFIYGCKNQTPEKQYCSRIFPAMLGKNIPELFNFDKCKFAVQKEKEGTGRIVMWREGITNSYTLEATFCGTTGNELEEGYHFNSTDFEKMGSQFCDTLLDYIDPDHSKMEHIMEYLKNRSASLKMSKLNESEDGLFTSDDSESDSSDVGSDSSNCDELPAYYAYILQKKKGKSKRRMSQKREAKSINKKKTQSKTDAGTNHCVACCRDLNLTEENPKSRKHTPNKSECKKSSKIEVSNHQTSLGNRQNGYVSDGDISFKRNYTSFYSSTGKHAESDMICLKPYNGINKLYYYDKQRLNQSSTSQEILYKDHTTGRDKTFTRRESLRQKYHLTNQDLDLPKIDIGSNSLVNRFISIRRTYSAPTEHTQLANLPSSSLDFMQRKYNLNSNVNKRFSLENAYDSLVNNYSDIYHRNQSNISENVTIKHDCVSSQKCITYSNHFNHNEQLNKIPLFNNLTLMRNGQHQSDPNFSQTHNVGSDNNNNSITFSNINKRHPHIHSTMSQTTNEKPLSFHIQRKLNEIIPVNKRSDSHHVSSDALPSQLSNKLKMGNQFIFLIRNQYVLHEIKDENFKRINHRRKHEYSSVSYAPVHSDIILHVVSELNLYFVSGEENLLYEEHNLNYIIALDISKLQNNLTYTLLISFECCGNLLFLENARLRAYHSMLNRSALE